MHPSQQHPPTRQQPTLRPPRHRSVSSETVLVPAKPHPQQLKDPSLLPPSGACTPGVRRYPSENALAPTQDAGVVSQFEWAQRRETKGAPPSGSPYLLATPSYWGTGGRTSGAPQGIGKGEPPGQLKLPSIVNSSHQADPLLLSNHRSKSGSQVMSPTFIKKFNSGTGWGGVGRGGVREVGQDGVGLGRWGGVGPGGVGLGSVLFVCSKWSAKEDCSRSQWLVSTATVSPL